MADTSIANPFDTVSALLSQSIERRRKIAEDLEVKFPAIVETLIEAALGLWKESVQVTRKGERKVRVYQVEPDIKAINALIRLANYEPEEVASTLLNMSRIRSIEADVEAGIAKHKAENLRSQTFLNDQNGAAFGASFVVEEDVQGAALGVFSATMGYIQSIPVEVMRENCKDQQGYQEWQMQVAKIAREAYDKYVIDREDPNMLESGDNNDDSEEDEE